MKIDSYISELLYDHDCVIVTDLGGFIANYKPAAVNPALHVISPPTKKLAFNASLKSNDGLLANHIAGRTLMSYMDACDVIREYVKESVAGMKNGQKLKIDKVGMLYFDQEERLQFLPDQHANYLVDSFGLSAIHAPLIKRTVTEQEDVREPVLVPVRQPGEQHGQPVRIFGWKVLELIPAAAVLALLMMTPPVLREFNSNLSTLLPFSRMNEYLETIKGEKPERSAARIEPVNPFEIPPARQRMAPEPAASGTASEPIVTSPGPEAEASLPVDSALPVAVPAVQPVPQPHSQFPSVQNQGKTYHIIGGCFKSEVNANKFVAEWMAKGVEARIIGQNKSGLYMVSVFASESYNQVTDALPGLKSTVTTSAWVLKK